MSKQEARQKLLSEKNAGGNLSKELLEVKKLQLANDTQDIITLTVGCSKILTIVCCA